MAGLGEGYVIEDYARRLAASLGVPDFVYQSATIHGRRGNKEVGDGLLISGQDGLIIQVKHREQAMGELDSPQEAETWLRKHAAKACRQVRGTRRTLRAAPIAVTSLRGFERTTPANTDWPGVVILDHPAAPTVLFDRSADTLIISLTDWEQLHRMLRSTTAVIGYVRQALRHGLWVALGCEVDRYRALAYRDSDGEESATSPRLSLPSEELDGLDRLHASIVDELVERVADPLGAVGWLVPDYLQIVEKFDGMPLPQRVMLGERILRAKITARDSGSPGSGLMVEKDGNRVAFLCNALHDNVEDQFGPGPRDWFTAEVGTYAFLRQHQALEAGARPETSTLTVGILYSAEYGWRYVFVLTVGVPPEIPVDIRQALESDYGVFTGRSVVSVA